MQIQYELLRTTSKWIFESYIWYSRQIKNSWRISPYNIIKYIAITVVCLRPPMIGILNSTDGSNGGWIQFAYYSFASSNYVNIKYFEQSNFPLHFLRTGILLLMSLMALRGGISKRRFRSVGINARVVFAASCSRIFENVSSKWTFSGHPSNKSPR